MHAWQRRLINATNFLKNAWGIHSKFSQAQVTVQVTSAADFGGHVSDAVSHPKRAL